MTFLKCLNFQQQLIRSVRVFIALLKRFGHEAFYLICSRQQIFVEMLKAIFLTCEFAEKGKAIRIEIQL